MIYVSKDNIDRTVVRNRAYRKNEFSIRERHNERKNEVYQNPDIILERTAMNVHFKECNGTYAQMFDKLVEDKIISTRGLRDNAYIFDEMVFDVNSAYFENNGGYEYAKEFYKAAYKMAVQEVGGEQYILSAVMHADEKNCALSDNLGQDVYHYHLHVTYVPVVEKEIKWTKRCKEEHLRGTVKETIWQVSHSKKWKSGKETDEHGNPIYENGRAVLIPSYSLLQDRFYEHMKNAGFEGFERGIKGSTAEHLLVLDYKIQQDLERLSVLEEKTRKQENKLTLLNKEEDAARQVQTTVREIEEMGKKTFFGKIELSPNDYENLLSLAKEGLTSRHKIATLEQTVNALNSRLYGLTERFDKLFDETRTYREAVKLAPKKVQDFLIGTIRERRHKGRSRKRHNDEYIR